MKNSNMNILQKLKKTKQFILCKRKFNPEIAIIAGSGLSDLSDHFECIASIEYSKIPYFFKTTVSGHEGILKLCRYKNKDILIFSGRFHFYEGFSNEEIIYPIRVMKEIGIKTLIITAATGGINKNYSVGDIVVLNDHINFTGNNPLIGKHNEKFGKRFPDMSAVYDKDLINKVLDITKKNNIKAHSGVYFGVSGPSYETPAEIKAFEKLGGDIIGMSVVYEAIAASQMNMKVLGLVYVSNMAAGIVSKELKHSEVLAVGKTVNKNLTKIIKNIIEGDI